MAADFDLSSARPGTLAARGKTLPSVARAREDALPEVLENAVSVVEHSYLERLSDLEIVPPSSEELDVNPAKCGKFYHLTHLVYDRDEHFLDKLVTVVNAAFSLDGTLATIIHSDGVQTAYYLGILSKRRRTDSAKDISFRKAAEEAFSGAVKGNFTGSRLEEVGTDALEDLQRAMFGQGNLGAVSAVSGIVGLRGKEDPDARHYVQGIENLTGALHGKAYTILMLADPVSSAEIQLARQGYEEIYSNLSAYAQSVLSFNETEGDTISDTLTKGVTEGITDGITKTLTMGTFKSNTLGGNVGIKFGFDEFFGISGGINFSRTKGSSQSESTGENHQKSHQEMKQDAHTTGKTTSQGATVQFTKKDRRVQTILEKIDQYIKRLENCANYGAFNCTTYVLSKSHADALAAASNYNALMRGEDSFLQASQINLWEPGKQFDSLAKYLRAYTHPRFYLDRTRNHQVTPATLMNGRELAIQFGLPKKSIRGLSVMEMAAFGRDVPVPKYGRIQLGELYHMGRPEKTPLLLDPDTLTSHVFVTGSTGAGKSNTVYHLLHELCLKPNAAANFLVVEPAKGEYSGVLGGYDGVSVYGTNPRKAPLLRLNPFAFPDDIHVLEHIDRLVEVFNACWPMYAAMPAVLKDAIEASYVNCGWSLSQSISRTGRFPTFGTLLDMLPKIMRSSAYSKDTQGDYTGALVTRVKSLTNGVNGQIFCSGGALSGEQLFDRNVIVDLSRVGSMETKALLMGVLMIQLQEYRMSEGTGRNASLRHLTVLEEAHNLLRRTSPAQSQEGANLQGKSVEMLSNAIAEMRTYGEGFVIADQAPGLLDMAVIRNTNTKIILRLPEESDRELTGGAARLSEEQAAELSRLDTGVAAVFQNHWLEPVLCKVERFEDERPFQFITPQEAGDPEMNQLMERLFSTDCPELPGEIQRSLKRRIDGMNLGSPDKKKLYRVLETPGCLTDGQRGSLLAHLTDGKTLIAQADNGNNPDMVEGRLMDLLQVNAALAEEIRKDLYSYAVAYGDFKEPEKKVLEKYGRD